MAEFRNSNSEQGSRRRPARGGVSSATGVDDTNNGSHSNPQTAARRNNHNHKNVGGGLWALLVFLLVYGPAPAQQQRGTTLTAILVLVFVVLLLIPLVLYLRLSHLFPDHFSTHSLRASPHHPPWKPPPHTPRDWSWWQHHHDAHQNNNKPWLVFYNVYIPNESESQQHALGIISEQMKQVQESYAFTASKGSRLHLFYNTIGTDSVLTKEWIQQLFGTTTGDDGNQTEMVVHHGQHYAEANEDVTLQDLYDFCNSPEVVKHEDDIRVIYLHSKGSFHYEKPSPNGKDDNNNNNKPAPNKKPKFETQDRWRRLLTRAATHRYCLEQPSNDNMVCDTCSLLMQPLPSVHYPGNMWSARASYIRKLLPPLGFDQRMDRFVVKQFTRFRDEHGSLLAGFFPQMPHMMGRKRFAPEHWLGSSPYLLHPCHLTPTANLSEWLHPDNQEGHGNLDNNHLQMIPAYPAPGFPIEHAFWDFYRYGKRGETVLHNATLRLRDYFLLPGQIMKWYQLYGTVPPPESWVWKWFPDAGYWQEQIQQHASKTTTGTLDDNLLGLWATKSGAGAVQ